MPTEQSRPIFPNACGCQIFDTLHSLAYPSIQSTKALIASRFMWHGYSSRSETLVTLPRFGDKLKHHCRDSLCQTDASTMSTLTSLELFQNLEKLFTSSPSWIDSQDGRKQFCFLIIPPPPVHVVSSLTRLPASVYRQASLQTKMNGLPLHCSQQ